MIVSKRDSSNIFDGCLAYLKSSLNATLSGDEKLGLSGIVGLVGSPTQEDVINHPAKEENLWMRIFFGKKYIFPCSFSIMGRRDPRYKRHYLKGWAFFGRNKRGDWKKLGSDSDNAFSFGENRTYPITTKEPFNAFMIQMTQPDTEGCWHLCLGQIEVFGDIYPASCVNENGFIRCFSHGNMHRFPFLLLLLSFVCST